MTNTGTSHGQGGPASTGPDQLSGKAELHSHIINQTKHRGSTEYGVLYVAD
jgi:hypothetical protein